MSCHQGCTDFDEPDLRDTGRCTPLPVRRDCEAPVLPVPECDEQAPVVEFDPDTETFKLFTTLYDENCSPILDQNSSAIITQIG